jgi:hypothetical protein
MLAQCCVALPSSCPGLTSRVRVSSKNLMQAAAWSLQLHTSAQGVQEVWVPQQSAAHSPVTLSGND